MLLEIGVAKVDRIDVTWVTEADALNGRTEQVAGDACPLRPQRGLLLGDLPADVVGISCLASRRKVSANEIQRPADSSPEDLAAAALRSQCSAPKPKWITPA
ncbi:hypothetical protein ABZ468_36785 [Streptomyces sp. NPDC005708]|uniref:hypothetical protein n=1 Tax=unclassified Streptomyces TaxID=2593676 RepID=UPI0033DDE4D4